MLELQHMLEKQRNDTARYEGEIKKRMEFEHNKISKKITERRSRINAQKQAARLDREKRAYENLTMQQVGEIRDFEVQKHRLGAFDEAREASKLHADITAEQLENMTLERDALRKEVADLKATIPP